MNRIISFESHWPDTQTHTADRSLYLDH